MNPTVNDFILALNQVEEIDFKTSKVKLIEDQINVFEDNFSTYENNFVTKLNEKYALLIHDKTIRERSDLIRQFQIPKKFVYSDIEDDEIKKSVAHIKALFKKDDEIHELQLIPDFIIHKGEKDKINGNQKLIVEVKTERDLELKKFIWDFLKLNIYVEKFNFQTGIFLGVNLIEDKLFEFIDYYLKKKLYLTTRKDDLYIILKENYSKKENISTLQEIMYLAGIK